MGNATGLFNMLRNIGGSIGIAMATTALIRRSALHQSYLGANLTSSTFGASAEVRGDRRLSQPTVIGPPRRAPRLLRPDLRADAAAIGTARLCRCFPLDRIKARRPAAPRTRVPARRSALGPQDRKDLHHCSWSPLGDSKCAVDTAGLQSKSFALAAASSPSNHPPASRLKSLKGSAALPRDLLARLLK
jgi:hypothetical protein